jgi:hypothetical protein
MDHDVSVSTLHSHGHVLHQILLPLGVGDQAGGRVERTTQLSNEGEGCAVKSPICVQHNGRELHTERRCHGCIQVVFLSLATVAHRLHSTQSRSISPLLRVGVTDGDVTEQRHIREV